MKLPLTCDNPAYTAALYKPGTPQSAFSAKTVRLKSWHWEREGNKKYRPKSYASICAVKDECVFAWLSCWEWHMRAVCQNNYEPVYEDSCLELFLAANPGDPRYINIEVNPNGIYLCEFGDRREGRVALRELSDIEPQISILDFINHWWLANIEIPIELLRALYGEDYDIHDGMVMRGNFYKCGDKTRYPHWGAWKAVNSNPPGFHNPECFGEIILKEH